MKKKILRRLWHALGGLFFPTLAFFVPHLPLMIGLGILTALVVSIEIARLTIPDFNQFLGRVLPVAIKDREATRLSGMTYLLLGTLLTLGLFSKEIAITALYFTALGDPVAAFVGERFGRIRIGRKSFEGAAAGFTACLIAGLLLSLYTHLSLPTVTLGALVASAIEFLPIPLDDNLSMPVAAGLAMTLVRF